MAILILILIHSSWGHYYQHFDRPCIAEIAITIREWLLPPTISLLQGVSLRESRPVRCERRRNLADLPDLSRSPSLSPFPSLPPRCIAPYHWTCHLASLSRFRICAPALPGADYGSGSPTGERLNIAIVIIITGAVLRFGANSRVSGAINPPTCQSADPSSTRLTPTPSWSGLGVVPPISYAAMHTPAAPQNIPRISIPGLGTINVISKSGLIDHIIPSAYPCSRSTRHSLAV
ncbi:hypothetical protein BJX70DRAFT_146090 [Aspergillus crustosus]